MNWKVLISQLSFDNLTVCENAHVEDSTRQFEGRNNGSSDPCVGRLTLAWS